jgi:hypothetical protein
MSKVATPRTALPLDPVVQAVLQWEIDEMNMYEDPISIADLADDYIDYVSTRVRILAGFGVVSIEELADVIGNVKYVDLHFDCQDHAGRVPHMMA